MKHIEVIKSLLIVILMPLAAFGIVTNVLHRPAHWHTEPQYAAGEWKVEVQTPPCDSYKNLEVIYPKESGAPIAIECNLMPVPTR